MTTTQQEAAARLKAARTVSHHRAREAQRSNDRFARATEAAAQAETDRNRAHELAYAAQEEHSAALAAAIALGYRHSHRIDATQDNQSQASTGAKPDPSQAPT